MKFFQVTENGSSISKEALGGLTTFLTMAYILFVNPDLLSQAGMDKSALYTVTILASIIGTLLAAFVAKMPLAMAPGMGLNAFFTFTLVLGEGIHWTTALGVVFLSGAVFFILTLVGVREKIAQSIPKSLRLAVSAGIGLFISFIGLKSIGLIQANPATLVTLGEIDKGLIIGFSSLILILILEYRKVKGGILIGILAATIAGMLTGASPVPENWVSMPSSIEPLYFKLDILSALKWSLIGPIFSFMFVDLFDSIGTILVCAKEAKLEKKDGSVPGMKKILAADAGATMIGAVLGTSTTTTYIESAAGIQNGAKTGIASVFTALFFALALFIGPLALAVPAFATGPAL
ncbi:MAG: NCS2 family permease, partial [Flavobacteriaceae bacterium]